jgi:hypothetical protein
MLRDIADDAPLAAPSKTSKVALHQVQLST